MNPKSTILEELAFFLLKRGFAVKQLTRSFDILASKDKKILLIKVLKDGNSITKENALQLLNVSSILNAYPLLIASNRGINTKLEDGVFYNRFSLPMINFETFKFLIDNKPIFFRSTKAGIIAVIDGKVLKDKREELNLSLNDVSRKVGVSRKMVYKYEKESSQVTPNRAFRLYHLFGPGIFKTINLRIERPKFRFENSIFARKYEELGFEAVDTKNLPFNIIAKHDNDIILTEVNSSKPRTGLISRLLNVNSLLIFKKKRRGIHKGVEGVPAISKDDFLELKKARELIDFLKSFDRV